MRFAILSVHIAAASVGLLAGFVALYAAKGARLHRRSGTLFVYTMVAMAILGAGIAAVWNVGPEVNIPVALLTSYLVITALTAVTPAAERSRALALGLLLVAVGVAVFMIGSGLVVATDGARHRVPAFPFFLFGAIALLAVAGDLRVLRSGALAGASRIARHLWRMSAALLIASLSFAVQLPKYLPKSPYVPWLMALPLLAVLVTMFYWLWRVRSRRPVRGTAVAAPRGVLLTDAI